MLFIQGKEILYCTIVNFTTDEYHTKRIFDCLSYGSLLMPTENTSRTDSQNLLDPPVNSTDPGRSGYVDR